MVKSGSDTAFSFPVEPRRIIAAGAEPPSPERTLEAGRAKIRLWNAPRYRGGQGERQGRPPPRIRRGTEPASPQYDWLDRILAVGVGHGLPDGPTYGLFEVL
jgi:hypothetical protein